VNAPPPPFISSPLLSVIILPTAVVGLPTPPLRTIFLSGVFPQRRVYGAYSRCNLPDPPLWPPSLLPGCFRRLVSFRPHLLAGDLVVLFSQLWAPLVGLCPFPPPWVTAVSTDSSRRLCAPPPPDTQTYLSVPFTFSGSSTMVFLTSLLVL